MFSESPYSCYDEIELSCALRPGDGTYGDVQLVDATEDEFVIKGRLMVFNEFWGSVCANYYLTKTKHELPVVSLDGMIRGIGSRVLRAV